MHAFNASCLQGGGRDAPPCKRFIRTFFYIDAEQTNLLNTDMLLCMTSLRPPLSGNHEQEIRHAFRFSRQSVG